MLRTILRIGLVVPLALNLSIRPSPVRAQQSTPAPVCMAHAAQNPDAPTFVVAIPPSEQQAMADRGFTQNDCAISTGELAAYRLKVCHLANDAPATVQAQFEQEYNVSPKALCDMADVLATALP